MRRPAAAQLPCPLGPCPPGPHPGLHATEAALQELSQEATAGARLREKEGGRGLRSRDPGRMS